MRIHCGIGRFCFCFLPKIFLILKVFCDGCFECFESREEKRETLRVSTLRMKDKRKKRDATAFLSPRGRVPLEKHPRDVNIDDRKTRLCAGRLCARPHDFRGPKIFRFRGPKTKKKMRAKVPRDAFARTRTSTLPDVSTERRAATRSTRV